MNIKLINDDKKQETKSIIRYQIIPNSEIVLKTINLNHLISSKFDNQNLNIINPGKYDDGLLLYSKNPQLTFDEDKIVKSKHKVYSKLKQLEVYKIDLKKEKTLSEEYRKEANKIKIIYLHLFQTWFKNIISNVLEFSKDQLKILIYKCLKYKFSDGLSIKTLIEIKKISKNRNITKRMLIDLLTNIYIEIISSNI